MRTKNRTEITKKKKKESQSPKSSLWATKNRRVGQSHTIDPRFSEEADLLPSAPCWSYRGWSFPENTQVISPQLFPPFLSEIGPQHRSLPWRLDA